MGNSVKKRRRNRQHSALAPRVLCALAKIVEQTKNRLGQIFYDEMKELTIHSKRKLRNNSSE